MSPRTDRVCAPVGQAMAEQARGQAPRPFTGYLVASAGFTPPARTKQSWLYHLPPLFYGIGDAQSERVGFQAMAPEDSAKSIFKVTVTFEIVEDGSRD